MGPDDSADTKIMAEKYSGPKLLTIKVQSVIFPLHSHVGDEGMIYRSKLFDPIQNDLTFHSRQNWLATLQH